MGKRSAILIGAAAVAVIVTAVPATSAGVHKYDTKLTITREGHHGPCGAAPPKTSRRPHSCVLWHGGVNSEVRECEDERRVVLFRKRSGADKKLGTALSEFRPDYGYGSWGLEAPTRGLVYAKVGRKVGGGFVCREDRSRTLENGQPIDQPGGLGGP